MTFIPPHTPYPTPIVLQEGPDLLSALEDDAQLGEEQAAWTPVLSSTSEAVKNQVGDKALEVEAQWRGCVLGRS